MPVPNVNHNSFPLPPPATIDHLYDAVTARLGEPFRILRRTVLAIRAHGPMKCAAGDSNRPGSRQFTGALGCCRRGSSQVAWKHIGSRGRLWRTRLMVV